MQQQAVTEERVLALQGVVKHFGGVRALDGANLAVGKGTIHGLIGQNGAGKSTLIKVLAGLHRPDAGSIAVNGRSYAALTPRQAEALGVQFIHQDRLLVPTFTVGEALFLGSEPQLSRVPLLSRTTMKRRAGELVRHYFDVDLPLGVTLAELTPAEQQIVQITRALLRDPTLLVLDEPTAALAKREADHLFTALRRLRRSGLSIIYISHYLQEIEVLCDRATVLRNGRDVGTVEPKTTPQRAIVSMMVAGDIADLFPKVPATVGAPLLTVNHLGRRNTFEDVSFELRRGEILGLTGLVGSGSKEVLQALFGLRCADSGSLIIDDNDAQPRSPAAAVKRRVALVPEDRRGQGAAMTMTVRENATLASLATYARGGFMNFGVERRGVDALIARLAIRTASQETVVRDLSGGNQQKVVLAKWLSRQSELYILDEPTAGIDVGAKAEIYRLIGELAAQGAGVLVLSNDVTELVGLSDRILVMYRGRITAEFITRDTSETQIVAAATGAADVVSASSERAAARAKRGRVGSLLRLGSFVAFAGLMAYFAVAAPGFLAFSNLVNIVQQSAILGVLAFGMTIVIIGGGAAVVSGGMDLSIAANLGLCAALYAVLLRGGQPDAIALPATLLLGVVVGLINAVAIVGIGIVPLLATLAIMNVCAGFELVLTQNTVVPAASPVLSFLAGSGPLGIPVLAIALIAVAALLIVGVQFTPLGLRLYAVGGHPEAARAAGLPLGRYIGGTYVLSGLCAAIGAVLSVSLLNGSTTGAGDILLSVVLTALLGVVFSARLVPTISGTFLSVLFVGVLINGFQLTNVSSYWVNGVEGVLILLVVSATSVARRSA